MRSTLQDLRSCCDESSAKEDREEIDEALKVIANVPKRANDILHLSLLEGCNVRFVACELSC